VARLAGVGAGIQEGLPSSRQLIDSVELPGKVVEPYAAAALRRSLLSDAEQAEIVMVLRSWEAQEGRIGAWLTRSDLHPENLPVEPQRTLKISDEEDSVIEPHRTDGHLGTVPVQTRHFQMCNRTVVPD
jgi:hypothetical protein